MTPKDCCNAVPIEILLVEDNPGDAELTTMALQDGKVCINVNAVVDGLEALAFLRREGQYGDAPSPDLVLLDLNLPRKDGRETLAEIRKDRALSSVPIVIFTTSGAERDIAECYRLHANCYIRKPVDLDRLVKVVNSIEEFWLTIVTLPQWKPTRRNPATPEKLLHEKRAA